MRAAIAAIVTILLGCSPSADAETVQPATAKENLLTFLRSYLKPQSIEDESRPQSATKLQIGWVDLNADGLRDALVYVSSAAWCGTGGCTLVIVQRTRQGFRIRGHLTVTRPPVAVLDHAENGWRDVTVYVSGGGMVGHTVVVPFNGERYARNPTVPPAYPLRIGTPEAVVMGDDIYPFLGR